MSPAIRILLFFVTLCSSYLIMTNISYSANSELPPAMIPNQWDQFSAITKGSIEAEQEAPSRRHSLSVQTRDDLNRVQSSLKLSPSRSTDNEQGSQDNISINRGRGWLEDQDFYETIENKDKYATEDIEEEGVIKSKRGIDLSVKSASAPIEHTLAMQEYAFKALMSGQNETAIYLYEELVSIDPKNTQGLFGLATAYQRNHEYGIARNLYADLIEKDPKNHEAVNNFLAIVAEESPEEAIISLKKIQQQDPNLSIVYAQLGMIYAKLKDFPSAEQYLRKALTIDPENLSYRFNLAILLDQQKKQREASVIYRQLLDTAYKGDIPSGTIPVKQIEDRLLFLSAEL